MSADPRTAWSLHPQLEADAIAVGDLALSRVLIINDANYPWLILVPRQPGVTEILDLNAVARAQLMDEMARAGAALKEITACDKLNIAALGNVVPQLHIHIIARHKSDAAWPMPVWGRVKARSYDGATLARFVSLLKQSLDLD